MKKRIFIIGLCSLIFASCIEDSGNYTYLSEKEVLPVVISGIDENITAKQGGQLKLLPNVSIAGDESRYTYRWYATDRISAGALPKKFEIGSSRNLDLTVNLPVGQYYLYYEIRDAEKDIYSRKRVVLLVVGSDVSYGWYILKDKNNVTDFDYINEDGEMTATVLTLGGNQLKGTARFMSNHSSRYVTTYIDETTGAVTKLSGQKALHVLSSEDFKTIDAQTMGLFKTFDEEFYTTPERCDPQYVFSFNTGGDAYVINAGQLHSIYGMSANIGKFAAPKAGDPEIAPVVDLFPYAIITSTARAVLVFDKNSRTFMTGAVGGSGNDASLRPATSLQTNAGNLSLVKMPYTMVTMCSSEPLETNLISTQQGYAIMKNMTDDTYRIAAVLYGGTGATLLKSFNAIDAGSQLPHAPVVACAATGNFLYFGVGNKVSYYDNSPGLSLEDKEKLLVTLPAGETVSAIKNVYNNSMNVMAVLANTGTHWKLYVYKIKAMGTPDLVTTPEATYTGEGNGRFIMYRSF